MSYKFCFERKFNVVKGIASKAGNVFDPITIFGDLIITNSDEVNDRIKNFIEIFGDIEKNEIVDYVEYMKSLQIRIDQGKLKKLIELENIRPFYDLRFSYQFVILHRDGHITPMLDGFYKTETPSNEKLREDHCCIYTCPSMRDVPFSIMHYLFLNDYKIRKCEHCGKYFATKNLKQKYCPRMSPYKGFECQPCGKAVDHILKRIKKRRKAVYKNISDDYPKAIVPFCEEYDAAFVEEKSVSNLKKLDCITSKKYVKEHWYKEEYR